MTETKICAWCDKEFTRAPNTANHAWGRQRYCNPKCSKLRDYHAKRQAYWEHKEKLMKPSEMPDALAAYLEKRKSRLGGAERAEKVRIV